MPGPLPYSLITVKVIELEKVTLTDMQALNTFLTHWLPMTSILFLVEKIEWKQFRCIYRKNKNFFSIFLCIFQIYINFWTFSKKRWPSYLMYFRNYGPQKTWLDKCLKRPVWEDPSTGNMVNGLKHWFNLNGSTFTIFVDHCEGNAVGESHS